MGDGDPFSARERLGAIAYVLYRRGHYPTPKALADATWERYRLGRRDTDDHTALCLSESTRVFYRCINLPKEIAPVESLSVH